MDNIGKKWVKSENDTEYFVKVGPTEWIEYHGEEIYAEFEEKQIYSPVLKRTDSKKVVRLIENATYKGNELYQIVYFADGSWEENDNPEKIGFKWNKSEQEYFEKVSSTGWVRFLDGKKKADYEEDNSYSPILEKIDGSIVELTADCAFFGENIKSIFYFTDGRWEN